MNVNTVPFDLRTGQVSAEALLEAAGRDAAAVYVEQPTFFGGLACDLPGLAAALRERETLFVVGADPSSLGVLEPPGAYGADLVCGDLQPLGLHMRMGGGMAGFVACRAQERFLASIGLLMVSAYPGGADGLTPTFWVAAMEKTSYGMRGDATEVTGTTQLLWGLVAGVYLSLMGPDGMRELGEGIIARRAYAIETLRRIEGLAVDPFGGPGFKEFVVDFSSTGVTVPDINARLRASGILGGHDLGRSFPQLQDCALYAVTEAHRRADIDHLAATLEEILT